MCSRRPNPPAEPLSRPLLLICLVVAAGGACSPTANPVTAASAARYPEYTDADATLFDDTLAPEVLGGSAMAATGRPLAERAEAADAILRVRVTTVTSQDASGTPAYTLVLAPVGPPLAGPRESEPLSVQVLADSPAYPLVRAIDSELVGTTFILLYRRYNEAGRVALHWHGVPDTDAERASIGQGRALGDFRK